MQIPSSRLAALALVALAAVTASPPVAASEPAPAPAEIVAAAPPGDWVAIAPDDLLVMDLAPDAAGKPRRVVIQLMPPPFSQQWIGNIRRLAAAHWWDGLSINRVQDNYVVQWGDADGEDKAKARPLPARLLATRQSDYAVTAASVRAWISDQGGPGAEPSPDKRAAQGPEAWHRRDAYAGAVGMADGWPLAADGPGAAANVWPVHCYGAVGVGRNMPPDAGTGAELYVVIGTPPRHLDRNIAVVGRVIEGIEHLSSLPRGTGPLGFYRTAAERTAITGIRPGSAIPGLPRYQYLATASATFARYADARANRRDTFFVRPAGGVDICNLPVPVRRAP